MPDLLELAAREYGPRLILEVDIPAIEVSSPVVAAGWVAKEGAEGGTEIAWDSPGSLAGWAVTSAVPGDGSNIILYGHNNVDASVFRDLGEVRRGDEVSLKTGEGTSVYRVSEVVFLKITFASAEDVEDYEQYLRPTPKEQLTIISCWPPVSNTHRVVVIAKPVR
jgi:sortase A